MGYALVTIGGLEQVGGGQTCKDKFVPLIMSVRHWHPINLQSWADEKKG